MSPRPVFEKQESDQPRPAAEPSPALPASTRDIRSAGNQAVQALRTPGLEAFAPPVDLLDETPVDTMQEPQVRAEIEKYDQWILSEKQSSPLENRVQKRLKALRGRLDALIPGMEIFETSYDVTVDSTPVEQMKLHEILDEIHRYERWIPRQIQTSPKKIAIEQRLPLLRRQRDLLEAGPKPAGRGDKHGDRHGAAGASGLYAPKPRSLTDPDLDPRQMSKAERDKELDAIAQYLPTNPPKAEIEKLRKAQALLLDASEHHDRKQDRQVRHAEIDRALTPAGSDDRQVDEALARFQSIVPDPNRPGLWLLFQHQLAITISDKEMQDMKARLTATLSGGAHALTSRMTQVEQDWESEQYWAEKYPKTHALAAFSASVEDTGDLLAIKNQSIVSRDLIDQNLQEGNFREAFRKLSILETRVNHYAEKEAKSESDLTRGATRLWLAGTIAKETLTILATAGIGGEGGALAEVRGAATGLKSLVVASGKVAALTTVVGGGAAFTASVANQATEGDVDWGEAWTATREGGGATAKIGVMGAGGAVANEVAGVANAVGKAKYLKAGAAGAITATSANVAETAISGKGSYTRDIETGVVGGGVTGSASAGMADLTAGASEPVVVGGQFIAGGTGGAASELTQTTDPRAVGESFLIGGATSAAISGFHLLEGAPKAPKGEPPSEAVGPVTSDGIPDKEIHDATSRTATPAPDDGVPLAEIHDNDTPVATPIAEPTAGGSPPRPPRSGTRPGVAPAQSTGVPDVEIHDATSRTATPRLGPQGASGRRVPTSPGAGPTQSDGVPDAEIHDRSTPAAAPGLVDAVPIAEIHDHDTAIQIPVPSPGATPRPSHTTPGVGPYSEGIPTPIIDALPTQPTRQETAPEAATQTPLDEEYLRYMAAAPGAPRHGPEVAGPRLIHDPADAAARYWEQWGAMYSEEGGPGPKGQGRYAHQKDFEGAGGRGTATPGFIDRDGVVHVDTRRVDLVRSSPAETAPRPGGAPSPGARTRPVESASRTPPASAAGEPVTAVAPDRAGAPKPRPETEKTAAPAVDEVGAPPQAEQPGASATAREYTGGTRPGYAAGPGATEPGEAVAAEVPNTPRTTQPGYAGGAPTSRGMAVAPEEAAGGGAARPRPAEVHPTPIAEPATGLPYPGAQPYVAREIHYVKVRVPDRHGFRTVNIAPNSRSEDLAAWVIDNEAQAVAAFRRGGGRAIHISLETVQAEWATAGGDRAPPSMWITRGGELHLNGHRIRAAGLIW